MSAELLRVFGTSLLASSAAIVLVLALRAPLRRRFGARVAYAIWVLIPVTSIIALLPPPTAATVLAVVAANSPVPASIAPLASLEPLFDPQPWIAGAWLIGACLALIGLLVQQRNFVRALGRLSVIDTDVMRAQSTCGCPALIGAIRPRIVLPVDFEQRYDRRERELILIHERTHRARGDAQVNALAALLRCVFWFNPLVYFAASRFRFDQELACDAIVISRFPEARRSYADAMLKTQLAADSKQYLALPVGCHWQSNHPLKERITMLKQPLPGRARSALGAAVAIALIVGGTYAAWAAQPAAPAAIKNADANWIGASITVTIDGGTPHTVALPNPMQEPFAVREGEDGNYWEWQGSVAPAQNGAFEFTTILKHNGIVVSKPRLIVNEGKPVAIKAGEENGANGFKGFVAQITLTHASARHVTSAVDSKSGYRALRPIAYPAAAIAAKLQGVVYVSAHIAADGSVANAHVDHVDPPTASLLADAAIAGVKTWTFDPARKNGNDIASDEIVPVVFALDPGGDAPRVERTELEPISIAPQRPEPTADAPPSENVSYRMMSPPQYPLEAVRAKQSARLLMRVLVDEQGLPKSIAVDSSEPPELAQVFSQASIAAIKTWRFNPGIKDGKPSAGYIKVPIDFVISDDDG